MKDNLESGGFPQGSEIIPAVDLSSIEQQIKLAEQQAGIVAKSKEEVVAETIAMVEGNRRLNKRTTSNPKFNAAYTEAETRLAGDNQTELVSEERAIEREAVRIASLKDRLQVLADNELASFDLGDVQAELDQAEINLQAKRDKLAEKKVVLEQDLQNLKVSNADIIADQEDIAKNDVDFAVDTVLAGKPGRFNKAKIKEEVSINLDKKAELEEEKVKKWEAEQQQALDEFEALLTDIESRLNLKAQEREARASEFIAELEDPESDLLKTINELRKKRRKKSSGLFAGRDKNQREISRLEREEETIKEFRVRDFWQLNYDIFHELDPHFLQVYNQGGREYKKDNLLSYYFTMMQDSIVGINDDKLQSVDQGLVKTKVDDFLQRYQSLMARKTDLQNKYESIQNNFHDKYKNYERAIKRI